MARKIAPWLYALATVVAIATGSIVAIVASNGGEPRDPLMVQGTVGSEGGLRFELITGKCGYEVVVTADTTVDPNTGEFCLVRLDVRNGADEPRSLDPSCQYLIDTSGARHRQREDVLPLDEVTAELFGQQIAPGAFVKDAGLYYDVPKGTEVAAVELHAPCGSRGLRIPVPA